MLVVLTEKEEDGGSMTRTVRPLFEIDRFWIWIVLFFCTLDRAGRRLELYSAWE